MKKLEESLDLLEKTENYKEHKQLLDARISELLEDYNFKPIKEKDNLKLYALREEAFMKFNKWDKDEYCWAKPKELNHKKFYKSFKNTLVPSSLQFLASLGVSVGVAVSAFEGLSYAGVPIDNPLTAAAILASSAIPLFLGFNYFKKRNKKKLEENCEEIYYGKEALEKAFRR